MKSSGESNFLPVDESFTQFYGALGSFCSLVDQKVIVVALYSILSDRCTVSTPIVKVSRSFDAGNNIVEFNSYFSSCLNVSWYYNTLTVSLSISLVIQVK